DDRDLDATDQRKLSSLELPRDRGVLAIRRHRFVEDQLAEPGVRFENDAMAALVFAEQIRPGPHRMRPDVEAVGFGDLPRDRGGGRHRKYVNERVVGLLETNAKRVAVDDLETPDRGVVVELAVPLRRGDQFVAAHELAFDEPGPRGLE